MNENENKIINRKWLKWQTPKKKMESNAYVIRTNTMSWNLKDKKWSNLIKNFIPQILKIEGRVMQA